MDTGVRRRKGKKVKRKKPTKLHPLAPEHHELEAFIFGDTPETSKLSETPTWLKSPKGLPSKKLPKFESPSARDYPREDPEENNTFENDRGHREQPRPNAAHVKTLLRLRQSRLNTNQASPQQIQAPQNIQSHMKATTLARYRRLVGMIARKFVKSTILPQAINLVIVYKREMSNAYKLQAQYRSFSFRTNLARRLLERKAAHCIIRALQCWVMTVRKKQAAARTIQTCIAVAARKFRVHKIKHHQQKLERVRVLYLQEQAATQLQSWIRHKLEHAKHQRIQQIQHQLKQNTEKLQMLRQSTTARVLQQWWKRYQYYHINTIICQDDFEEPLVYNEENGTIVHANDISLQEQITPAKEECEEVTCVECDLVPEAEAAIAPEPQIVEPGSIHEIENTPCTEDRPLGFAAEASIQENEVEVNSDGVDLTNDVVEKAVEAEVLLFVRKVSAQRIQRIYRDHRKMQQLVRYRYCVLLIQRKWRDNRKRKREQRLIQQKLVEAQKKALQQQKMEKLRKAALEAKKRKQQKASTTIVRALRLWQHLRQVQLKKQSVILIQSCFRRHTSKRHVEKLRQEHCATLYQNLFLQNFSVPSARIRELQHQFPSCSSTDPRAARSSIPFGVQVPSKQSLWEYRNGKWCAKLSVY